MIEVSYPTNGDRGEFLGFETIGYFNSVEEAKKALVGLCPWDFNNMWASGYYTDFRLHGLPGKITNSWEDKDHIKEREANLKRARKHAKDWKNTWHKRAPKNW
jgi:hypothetical protein